MVTRSREVTPPVRRVGLRFVDAVDRFVPCHPKDSRATIVARFDAAGMSVAQVGGRWEVTPGARSNPWGPAPGEVVGWFDLPKSTRRRKGAARASERNSGE
jgi:hypothetical protein